MQNFDITRLKVRPAERFSQEGRTCLVFVSFFFLAGCFAGSVIGSASFSGGLYFDVAGYAETVLSRGWAETLWLSGRYVLLAFLMGFALFGPLGIPAAVFLRGYVISCTAASVLSCADGRSFEAVLALAGLDSLFSVPCLIVVSVEALGLSRMFTRLFFYGGSRESAVPLLVKFAAAAVILAAGAAAESYLIPLLVTI